MSTMRNAWWTRWPLRALSRRPAPMTPTSSFSTPATSARRRRKTSTPSSADYGKLLHDLGDRETAHVERELNADDGKEAQDRGRQLGKLLDRAAVLPLGPRRPHSIRAQHLEQGPPSDAHHQRPPPIADVER